MKTLMVGAAALLSAGVVQAQYNIDWWSIDGGGGRSTGGVFSVTGTIGQADAGLLSGGTYTLQGGFWGVVAAIQTPGAPTLSITQANALVTVSWPIPADGWVLERTLTLSGSPAPWVAIPAALYQTNATQYSITITNVPSLVNAFFRLKK